MINIRLAQPGDAQAIAAVHVASWHSAYTGLVPANLLNDLSLERRQRMWSQILDAGETETWVATVNEEIVGFVHFGLSRDEPPYVHTGEIYAIYLLADYWGQGLGASLCVQACSTLRDKGYEAVFVWVLHNNLRAIRFYELAGFQADGVEKTEQWGLISLDEVRYSIFL